MINWIRNPSGLGSESIAEEASGCLLACFWQAGLPEIWTAAQVKPPLWHAPVQLEQKEFHSEVCLWGIESFTKPRMNHGVIHFQLCFLLTIPPVSHKTHIPKGILHVSFQSNMKELNQYIKVEPKVQIPEPKKTQKTNCKSIKENTTSNIAYISSNTHRCCKLKPMEIWEISC